MTAAIYTLDQLCLAYPNSRSTGSVLALDQITLTISPDEVVGIIGPNGAGKSSLLQLLNGRYAPNSGRILLSGQPLQQQSAQALARQVATVAQISSAPQGLFCEQVAAMGLLPHKRWYEGTSAQDKQQVRLALQQVGLADKAQLRADTLSGGELQRLYIARALVQQATILLLDEPTNHLDVKYQHQVLQLLQGLNKTIICCLHDLNLAARYCHKLLLLENGRVRAYGTPHDVLRPALLQQVFGLPCVVSSQADYGWLQVTFIPELAHAKVGVPSPC
ncbi:ABC transporter ATP-binding protein [Rheinheimera sp. UJ63]|uniref:ABC transporter ATP-binding protein n=1 Tax=Rheinheimera sp. UJ63 TaxID=2910157 RepID=UPI001F295DAB|nr:ABC transporter ATP-binding protein [Rheinheimera sp. UJ63]MCF4009924.1 ABC transporter ATP-binding protein [Rheinheimera sp. UJ63]